MVGAVSKDFFVSPSQEDDFLISFYGKGGNNGDTSYA